MALRREWTDSAFPVLDPRGFYSTSGACSVSPFTTTVSGEGSARRQPEVASSSPRRNGHNLHRGGKSRFGFMSILGTQPNHTMLDPNGATVGAKPGHLSLFGATPEDPVALHSRGTGHAVVRPEMMVSLRDGE
jgi:hypothetical protein